MGNFFSHLPSILNFFFRVYFYEQSLKQADTGEAAQMQHKLEEEEHLRLMEENRLENEKTAKLREERLKAQAEKTAEKALRALSKKQKDDELFDFSLEKFVKEQQVSTAVGYQSSSVR